MPTPIYNFGGSSGGSGPRTPSATNAFAPKRPSGLSASYAAAEHEEAEEDAEVATLHLLPPLYPRKGRRKWAEGGRIVGTSVSPVGGECVIWGKKRVVDANAEPSGAQGFSIPDKTLFTASPHFVTKPLHDFYAETSTLFASLQHIVASGLRLPNGAGTGGPARTAAIADAWDAQGRLVRVEGMLGPPSAETVGHMRRLVDMYLEELDKMQNGADIEAAERLKWKSAYHIFHLAEILYLPQDGRGEGLLGEELLDWVNAVDPAPDNSLGNEIMQTFQPWTHPSFWPYVARCILRGFHLPASSFLRTLSKHPSPTLRRMGDVLATQLSLFPRSHNTTAYKLDRQYLDAHEQWLARLRVEVAGVLGGREGGHWFRERDGTLEKAVSDGTEQEVRVLINLMEGKEETVLEQAADWREAVGAWGVLVNVSLKRDHLPRIMKRILQDIPVDPLQIAQSIEAHLCSGKVVDALLGTHELDAWLAAHLGDVFDKLALVPDDEERYDISLRDYFLLAYAEVLQGSPQHTGLWRIIADYMRAAGAEGRGRLRDHILRTSLRIGPGAKGNEAQQPAQAEEGDVFDGQHRDEQGEVDPHLHLIELREACAELKLEAEWRDIARVAADRFIRLGEYGLAATMCLEGQDLAGLGRLAERVIRAYIEQGDEAYLGIVATLPPTLLADAPVALSAIANAGGNASRSMSSGEQEAAMGVFAARLTFLAEFRDYLVLSAQGERGRAADKIVGLLSAGIVPEGLRAVLLLESIPLLEDEEILFDASSTFELMRVMEEVSGAAGRDEGTYLEALVVLLKRRADEDTGAGPGTGTGTGTAGSGAGEIGVDPWRALEEVRLALARNLARALVGGFDGPF